MQGLLDERADASRTRVWVRTGRISTNIDPFSSPRAANERSQSGQEGLSKSMFERSICASKKVLAFSQLHDSDATADCNGGSDQRRTGQSALIGHKFFNRAHACHTMSSDIFISSFYLIMARRGAKDAH
jgi:hypothetical protein